MRCLHDAFANSFEPLKTVFAKIIALCEPLSPVSLWENNIANIVTDLRRRYASVSEAVKLLERDHDAQKYAMHGVENARKEVNVRLTVEYFGFIKQMEGIEPLPQPSADPVKTVEQQRKEIELAIKSFNDGQKAVFNAIVGAILLGVTADNPFASVHEPKSMNLRESRSFFFDAPGGTGKTFVTSTIQSFLESRGRKVISTATSAVASSLLERGRTAHSVFKIPIPCEGESVCGISLESVLAAQLREAD